MPAANNYEVFKFPRPVSGVDLFEKFYIPLPKNMRIGLRRFESCSGIFIDSLESGTKTRISNNEIDLLTYNYELSTQTIGIFGGSTEDEFYLMKLFSGRFLKNGLKTLINTGAHYNGIAVLPYQSIGTPKISGYAEDLKALHDKLIEKGLEITQQFSVSRTEAKASVHKLPTS